MKATDPGYDPGRNCETEERAMLMRRAFTAFCEGMTIREIASSTGIPAGTLSSRSTDDNWGAARKNLSLARIEHKASAVERLDMQIERIRENRSRNLGDAMQLRDVLLDIVTRLQSKTLTVKKVFCSKGIVTEVDAPPGTGDLVNIATFARTVADLTYRALGDTAADSKTDPHATASNTAPPAGITVILPAVAIDPRPRRRPNKAVVVDVESETKNEGQSSRTDTGREATILGTGQPSQETSEANNPDPS